MGRIGKYKFELIISLGLTTNATGIKKYEAARQGIGLQVITVL